MMARAASICHHWIAHVMPLYALLFPEERGEDTKFILHVRDLPLMDATKGTMEQHIAQVYCTANFLNMPNLLLTWHAL